MNIKIQEQNESRVKLNFIAFCEKKNQQIYDNENLYYSQTKDINRLPLQKSVAENFAGKKLIKFNNTIVTK